MPSGHADPRQSEVSGGVHLAEIEARSNAGDLFLKAAEREILLSLRSVQQPEDLDPIGQAYAAYAEATIYMIFQDRGVPLTRTPGTGRHGQKRPDFRHQHKMGDVYVEVKCLDFEGGHLRQRELSYSALDAAADLDARARRPGVHSGVLEISPFDPSATPADRIETLIKKVRGNAKMGQLTYGPCILVVDLGRLTPDVEHPSSLLPIYYNDGPPSVACASGELWHVALGTIGDTIYRIPEFEGKGNIDRSLKDQGILRDHPELLGVSFVVPRLSEPTEIYSIWNVTPDLAAFDIECGPAENDIGELIHGYSDAMNDDNNTYEPHYVRRL